jgi:RNA polymerase sigma-B factor
MTVVGDQESHEPSAVDDAQNDLGRASDSELLALIRTAPRGSRERNAACDVLVRRYEFLVRICAQQYRGCPEPLEELMQVGYVGLIKAINLFNPALGTGLRPYAEPCIRGEIKRYFRDQRWQVHVPRGARDLRLEMRASREDLTHQLARHPRDAELSRYIGITLADLAEAQRADRAFEAASLDAPLSSGLTLAEVLGDEDQALELALDLEALWKEWLRLPKREQRLLMLRFFGDMTQAEIGKRLGISQMQVSRLLGSVLGQLRDSLVGDEHRASCPQRGARHRRGQRTKVE